jgi:hypothetical protein
MNDLVTSPAHGKTLRSGRVEKIALRQPIAATIQLK